MRTVAYTPEAVSMRYRRVILQAGQPGYSRAMHPPGSRYLAGTDPVLDRALSYRVPS